MRANRAFINIHLLVKDNFLGLAKNTTFYGLAAIAANIRKGAKFLGLYGIAEPIILDRWA